MTYKPLIGLNCDFRAQVRSTPAFAYLGAGYYESIIKAGGVPVIIPPQIDNESISRITETLDGVVLVGGGDLDPRRDGFMLHPSVRLMDAGRETSDRMLMADVAERRMPLLAIGSGMQLMNVQQGGNLFLHIKEDLPNAVPHFDAQDTNHRHTLEIESDSLIGRVYGDGRNPSDQPSPHGSGRDRPGFPRHRSLPGWCHRSHRIRNAGLVRGRHAVPPRIRCRIGIGHSNLRRIH